MRADRPARIEATIALVAALLTPLTACVTSSRDPTATLPPGATGAPITTSTTSLALAREISATLPVDPKGITELLELQVPAGTRSISITAIGAPSDMIALASLSLSDGHDLVGLGEADWLGELLESQRDDHLPTVPGDIYQETGRGTFTLIYPEVGEEPVPPGMATLSLASTGDTVQVSIVMAPTDGSRMLELDLFAVNGAAASAGAVGRSVLSPVEGILTEAGIDVSWATNAVLDVPSMPAPDAGRLTRPGGLLEVLVAAARPMGTEAIDVFIVEDMPTGISGITPFIPGPPPPHPLAGVLVHQAFIPSHTGRTIAHEVAHYLGLRHLVDTDDGGAEIYDQFTDTVPGGGNLMEGGSALTDQQRAFLRLSPLLSG